MLERALDSLADWCARDDTRAAIEARFVEPAVRYLTARFQLGLRVFQAIALMVALQTVVLVWMCFRLSRLR